MASFLLNKTFTYADMLYLTWDRFYSHNEQIMSILGWPSLAQHRRKPELAQNTGIWKNTRSSSYSLAFYFYQSVATVSQQVSSCENWGDISAGRSLFLEPKDTLQMSQGLPTPTPTTQSSIWTFLVRVAVQICEWLRDKCTIFQRGELSQ